MPAYAERGREWEQGGNRSRGGMVARGSALKARILWKLSLRLRTVRHYALGGRKRTGWMVEQASIKLTIDLYHIAPRAIRAGNLQATEARLGTRPCCSRLQGRRNRTFGAAGRPFRR